MTLNMFLKRSDTGCRVCHLQSAFISTWFSPAAPVLGLEPSYTNFIEEDAEA